MITEVNIHGARKQRDNRLLVLIDGRSIFSPFYSGVYWEIHHVPVENIDRIEVIRGPGASLWGVNAVNGIINIITNTPKDYQEQMVRVAGGNQSKTAYINHPGAISERSHYSTYAHMLIKDPNTATYRDRYTLRRFGVETLSEWSGQSLNITFETMNLDGSMPGGLTGYDPIVTTSIEKTLAEE